MLEVSVLYERYKFLGHEFLTWLWYLTEKEQDRFNKSDPDIVSLNIGNRIVLENRLNEDAVESITIKGDDADLEEGKLALKKGAVVTELNLIYKTGEYEWRFSVKGENFNIGNLKTPDTGPIESKEDVEGAVLEKVYLYEKAISMIDTIFKDFIQLRISEKWHEQAVPTLKDWIYSDNKNIS